MLIETLSTFPHMYDSVMGASMMKRAQDKGLLEFWAFDLRDWTHDRHRTTDDDPYGGGAGLIMKCGPIFEAFEAITGCAALPGRAGAPAGGVGAGGSPDVGAGLGVAGSAPAEPAGDVDALAGDAPAPGAPDTPAATAGHAAHAAFAGSSARAAAGQPQTGPRPAHADGRRPATVFLTPCGRRFDDALACELSRKDRLLFVCGHYEGIDERAYSLADYQLSLGDYVLTGGELASMVVIDAVVRKIEGVLGAQGGALDESFAAGLLEHPQYTRPASFRGMEVPDVLLSGDHAAVARWRRERSLERTARLRPDLLEAALLTTDDWDYLKTLQHVGAPAPRAVP